jgi:glycosyltransferase involved in cell wall biosynthesis
MRIVVHDYSGHPFQVQLSRELARRGHEVLHLHCPSYSTGKGQVGRLPDDPAGFRVEGVSLGQQFEKYSLWKRPLQEREYARRLIRPVEAFRPEIVLSGNTPLLSQAIFQRACQRLDVPFVFWQQDVYSLPIQRALGDRLPLIGGLAGKAVIALERITLRRSDAIVTISEDFRPILASWGVQQEKLHVIENWAPLAECPLRPRENRWAQEHKLVGKRVFLYSGTIGVKHDPELLVSLAHRFREDPGVRVVVVTGDYGTDYLRRRAEELELENLLLLGFQPYEELPDVLASGDVLLVILDPLASVFSVPSKVLTYLCAGRPLLAALPAANLAARTVEKSGGGLVIPPDDEDAFLAGAVRLIAGDDLRLELGAAGRRYAEKAFDIGRVTDRFETVLRSAQSSFRGASARQD